MLACAYCALSTARGMHSVHGMIPDENAGHILLAWPPLVTSTVDARLRRHSSRKVCLDTALEAIIRERVSAWIPHCATHYSVYCKLGTDTKMVTSSGTQKRVSGSRGRGMPCGKESLPKAL